MAIEFQMPVRLKVLQDSISEFQKILNNLQPNTNNWKSLNRIINSMVAETQKLQAQTSVPFGSEKQFTQTEKTLNKLEDAAARVSIVMQGLKFSDIKLTQSQVGQFKQFEQEINKIRDAYKKLQEETKAKLLANDSNRSLIGGINKNALDKDFDGIEAAVEQHIKSLESKVERQKNAFDKLRNNIELGNRATVLTTSGQGLTREALGDSIFDKYLAQTEKGLKIKTWNTGVTKKALLEEIEKMFNLTPGELKDMASKTVDQINKAFQDMGKSLKNPFQSIIDQGTSSQKTKDQNIQSLENQIQQYRNLQIELEKLKSSSGMVEQSKKTTTEIEAIQQKITALETTITRSVSTNENYKNSLKNIGASCGQMRSQLDQVNAAFLKQQSVMNSFNSMKTMVTNFMGFYQVLNLTKKAIKDAANHIKELDTVMNQISIVTNMDTSDLWGQVDSYSAMAQKYGASIKGAYEVSKIYYQQGLETKDVLTLTNETLKLAKISGMDYAATTDYMTTALRGFKMEMSEASTVVDVYSNLASNTAVSQEELAIAMSKTASSMASVGSTFQEASAMIATMVAVTRESSTNIGSALKSIASRYGELTKDPGALADSEGEAMSFNKVDAALQSVGISMKTTTGQFREFTDVIIELGEKWDKLESTQQRYIATQFAGNRQQSRFLALVSNVDLLKENISNAENSEDIGTVQALKALDSLESKIEQVRVAYQQFYTTIGVESVWKLFLDGTKNVINSLNEMPKLFGKLPIAAISAIMLIVNAIKNIGLKALSTVAKQIGPIFSNGVNAAKNDAKVAGEGWFNTLNQAILNKLGVAQNTGKQLSMAYSAGIDSGYINKDKTITQSQYNQWSGVLSGKMLSGVSEEKRLNALANSMQKSGVLTDAGIAQIRAGGPEAIAIVQALAAAIRQEGTEGQQSQGKLMSFFQAHTKGLATLQSVGAALQMVALSINATGTGSKVLKGSLTALAGVITLVGTAATITKDTLNEIPWVAVASAIIAVVSGIVQAIDAVVHDLDNQIEAATKKAEELGEKAKTLKADYKTIDSSIKKMKELEQTRYDNEEAAQEYQDAVNELAQTYPILTESILANGDVVLRASELENILTEARQAAADAAWEAAKAEAEKAKLEQKKAKNDMHTINDRLQDIFIEDRGVLKIGNLSSTRINGETSYDQVLQVQKYLDAIEAATEGDVNPEEAIKQYEELIEYLGKNGLSLSKELSDALSPIASKVREYKSYDYTVAAANRNIVTSYMNKQYGGNENSIFTKNKGLWTFATNKLYELGEADGTDQAFTEEKITTYRQKALDPLEHWWNSMSSYAQSEMEEMLSNSDKYSKTDVKERAKELGVVFSKTNSWILDQFEDTGTNATRLIEKAESNLKGFNGKSIFESALKFSNDFKEITLPEFNMLSSIIDQATVLEDLGIDTNEFIEQSLSVYRDVIKLPAKMRNQILEEFINNGLTKEGLTKTLQYIENDEEIQAALKKVTRTDSWTNLETLVENARDNLLLTVNTVTETFKGDWEDIDKFISKLTSGFDQSSLESVLAEAEKYGFDRNKLEDSLGFSNGKYTIAPNQLKDIYTQISDFYSQGMAGIKEKVTESYDKIKNLDFNKETNQIAIPVDRVEYFQNVLGGRFTEFFKQNEEGNWILREEKAATELYDALIAERDNIVTGVENFTLLLEQWKTQMTLQSSWRAGDYSNFVKTDDGKGLYKSSDAAYNRIRELSRGVIKTEDEKNNQDLDNAISTYATGWGNVLNDLIDFGLGYVNEHLSTYEGIDWNQEVQISQDENGITESYLSLAEIAAQNAGKTVKEINVLMGQAIDKLHSKDMQPRALSDLISGGFTASDFASYVNDYAKGLDVKSFFDENGDFSGALKDVLSWDSETGNIKIAAGKSLQDVMKAFKDAGLGTIEKGSKLYEELLKSETKNAIEDADFKDVHKKNAAVLSELSKATVGSRIAVTGLSGEMQNKLKAAGFEFTGDYIEITSESALNSLMNALTQLRNDPNLDVQETNVLKGLEKYLKPTALSGIISETVSKEAAEAWAIATSAESAEAAMKALGYTWSNTANAYVQDLDESTDSIAEIQAQIDALDLGTDPQAQQKKNELQAKLNKLKSNKGAQQYSALSNIISNYQTVSDDAIKALADSLQLPLEKVQQYFRANGNGTYTADISGLINNINTGVLEVENGVLALLGNTIGGVLSSILSSLEDSIDGNVSGNYSQMAGKALEIYTKMSKEERAAIDNDFTKLVEFDKTTGQSKLTDYAVNTQQQQALDDMYSSQNAIIEAQQAFYEWLQKNQNELSKYNTTSDAIEAFIAENPTYENLEAILKEKTSGWKTLATSGKFSTIEFKIKEAQQGIESSVQNHIASMAKESLAAFDFESIFSGTAYKQNSVESLKSILTDLGVDPEALSDQAMEDIYSGLLSGSFDSLNAILPEGNKIDDLLSTDKKNALEKAHYDALSTALNELLTKEVGSYTRATTAILSTISGDTTEEKIASIKSIMDSSKKFTDAADIASREQQIAKATGEKRAESLIELLTSGFTEEDFTQWVNENFLPRERADQSIKLDHLVKKNNKYVIQPGVSVQQVLKDFGITDLSMLGDDYLNKITAEWSEAIASQYNELNAQARAVRQVNNILSTSLGEKISVADLGLEDINIAGVEKTGNEIIINSEAGRKAFVEYLAGKKNSYKDQQQVLEAIDNAEIQMQQTYSSSNAYEKLSSGTIDKASADIIALTLDASKTTEEVMEGFGYGWSNLGYYVVKNAEKLNTVKSLIEKDESLKDLSPTAQSDYLSKIDSLKKNYSNVDKLYETLAASIGGTVSNEAYNILTSTFNFTEEYFESEGVSGKKLNMTKVIKDRRKLKIPDLVWNALRPNLDSYYDNITGALSTATSYALDGLKDQEKIGEFIEQAKSFGVKIEDSDFIYSDLVESWVLDINKLVEFRNAALSQLVGLDSDVVDTYGQILTTEVARKQIDVKSFLTSDNRGIGSKAYQTLEKQLTDYYGLTGEFAHAEIHQNMPQEAKDAITKWNADRDERLKNMVASDIATISGGGKEAIDKMASLNLLDQFSTQEIESIYRAQIQPLVEIGEKIGSLEKGSIVSQNTAEILNTIDGFSVSAAGVVESVGDLQVAYQAVLDAMIATGEATVSDLNTLAKAQLNNKYKKNKTVSETLSQGIINTDSLIDMYQTATGKVFGQYTATTENGMHTYQAVDAEKELQNWIDQGLVEVDKLGQVTIKDFAGVAEKMAWEEGTKEYEDAYSAYIDAQIAENNKAKEKRAQTQMSNLISGNVGDEINVSDLDASMKEALGITGDTFTILSEFERDSMIMALDTATITNEATRRAVIEAKNQIQAKRSKGYGRLGASGATISQSDVDNFINTFTDAADYTNETKQWFMDKFYGYVWDEDLQEYIATADSLTKLDKDIEKAVTEGKSEDYIKALREKRGEIASKFRTDNKRNALSNLLSNYNDAADYIDEFYTQFGIDLESIEGLITTDEHGKKIVNVDKLDELVDGYDDVFSDLINQIADEYINNAQKAGSLLTQGTTSQTEIAAFKEAYNKLTGGTIEFFYDSVLQGWTYDASYLRTYLTSAADKIGFGSDASKKQWIEDQIKTLTVDNLDFSKVLSGTATTKETNELRRNLENYFKTHSQDYMPYMGTLEEWAKNRVDSFMNGLSEGGQVAIDFIKSTEKELTTEEISAAYRSQIEPLASLANSLSSLEKGSIVAKNQIEALRSAGFEVNADGVVQTVGDLVAAYRGIYWQMKRTGEATISELNAVVGNLLDNRDGEQQVIDALQNATSMTYSQLAQIYTNAGKELTEEMVGQMQREGILKAMGGNKVMIADFQRFADQMGWEAGSEEYFSALKTYRDGIISYNNKISSEIKNEFNAVSNAKLGDQINLSRTIEQYGEELFEDLGVQIKDGILTITDAAQLPKIATRIASRAVQAGDMIESELLDFIASIEDGIVSGITSATNLNISGTNSFASMQSFINDYNKIVKGSTIDMSSFYYDTLADTFKLDSTILNNYITAKKAELKEYGLSDSVIDTYIHDQTVELARNAISIDALLDATDSATRNREATKLTDAINTYLDITDDTIEAIGSSTRERIENEVRECERLLNLNNLPEGARISTQKRLQELQKDLSKLTAEQIVNILYNGGEEGVNWLKELKPDASSEEIAAVYNASINRLRDAQEQLGKGVGETVSGLAAEIIRISEGFEYQEIGNGDIVITVVGDMVEAYNRLYLKMQANSESTQADLNKAYADILTAEDQQNIDIVETLEKGTMSYSEFSEFLTKYNQDFKTFMQDVTNGVRRDGFGNIRIVDWESFAKKIFDTDNLAEIANTDEYLSAYKAYVDGLISLNKDTEQEIVDEIKQIESAKPGDWLNMAYLWSALQNIMSEALENIEPEGYAGNVDLANRPIVPAEKMQEYFEDFSDDYATLFSQSFIFGEEFGDNVGVLFTSLYESGEIVEDLADYVNELYNDAEGNLDYMKDLDSERRNLMMYGKKNTSYKELGEYGNNVHERGAAKDNIRYYNQMLELYGAKFEDGILKISDSANMLGVADNLRNLIKASGLKIENGLAEIEDAIQAVLKSYTEAITKGIKGGLTNVEMQDLKDKAYDMGISDLSFTETKEGFKLTTESAKELYYTLKEIDSLQAQIVFDELKESLIETNSHFRTIQDTTAYIIQLQKQLNALRAQEETPENKARIASLENELALAEQINRIRSIDSQDDSFNFMDNKIPDAQNNPLNYWKNWGEAFDAMKAAGNAKGNAKNTIGYEDFYNIVTEIGRLAELSGQSVTLGQTVLNNSQAAADLITQAAGALKNVDGEMKIDLSKINIDFSSGLDALGEQIDGQVDALAESQIAMLDSVIAVLEIIVAMEALEDVDTDKDMVIGIPEIAFETETGENGEEYIKTFTDKMEAARQAITQAFASSEEGKNALEQVYVNTQKGSFTMGQIVSATEEQLKEMGITAQMYSTIFTNLFKMYKDQDYNDLTGTVESVFDVFGKYDWGDMSVTVNSGNHILTLSDQGTYQFNFANANYDNLRAALNTEKNKSDEKIREEVQQAFIDESKSSAGISVETNTKIKLLQGDITFITDKKSQNAGKYKVNGQYYDNINQATAASDLFGLGADAKSINFEGTGKALTATGKVKIGNKEYDVESSQKGGVFKYGKERFNSQQQLLDYIYKEETLGEGHGHDKETIDHNSVDYQEWEIKQGIRVKPVFDVNNKSSDPSKDPQLKEDINKFISDWDSNINKGKIHFSEDGKTIKVELKEGVEATLPKDGFTLDTGEIDYAAVKQTLLDPLGIDEALKATISQGIIDAFKAMSEIDTTNLSTAAKAMSDLASQGSILSGISWETIAAGINSIFGTNFNTNKNNGLFGLFNFSNLNLGDILGDLNTFLEEMNAPELKLNSDVEVKPEEVTIDSTQLENKAEEVGNTVGTKVSEGFDKGIDELPKKAQNVTATAESHFKALETQIQAIITNIKNAIHSLQEKISITWTIKLSDGTDDKESVINKIFNGNLGKASDSGGAKSADLVAPDILLAIELDLTAIEDSIRQLEELLEGLQEDISVFNDFQGKVQALADDPALKTIKEDLEAIREELVKIKENANIDIKIKLDGADDAIEKLTNLVSLIEKLGNVNINVNTNGKEPGEGGTGKEGSENEPPASEQSKYSLLPPGSTVGREPVGGKENPFMSGGETPTIAAVAKIADIDSRGLTTEQSTIPVTGKAESITASAGIQPLQTPVQAESVEMPQAKGAPVTIKANVEPAENAFSDLESKTLDVIYNKVLQGEDPETADSFSGDVDYKLNQQGTPPPPAGSLGGEVIYKIVTEGSIPGGGGGAAGTRYPGSSVVALTKAKGNVGVAMANGTQTLMGELGPELVVSNGSYFIAGLNGAEMVDLAPDSIVFNHLQTEKLLKNGAAPGRGKAITNEQTAVAFATGNIGPAMASASQALAALKQLRAMWESLKSAKVSDLAGAGGGGGGGGGDKNKIVDPRAWIDTVERWYNLTQKIARLEEEITYQEKIRAKISSDWQKNGRAYYASQKKSLESLEEQVRAQEELNISRQDYYNKRVDALKTSDFGKVYTFDEEGQLQFNKNANLSINGKAYSNAMEWYTDLVGFDDLKGANYTNEQKYNILLANGMGDYMKYDSSGNEIKMDEDNDGEITDEERESFYEKATQAWKDKLDDYASATQSLYDEINKGLEQLEELEEARNQLLQEMRDNQMDLEEKVLDAIVESRQRQIDNLQDERDALEESVSKYIEGLSDALDKEQQMYQTQESQDELNRNRRRLAILQRSGGSVTDINSLQEEIRSQEREMYFDAQQRQIDAIQEASDKEIERLDNQISIMTQQLEYQKQFGLLWNDVYAVMNGSAEQIAAFIAGNSEEFWSASPLGSATSINDNLFAAESWVEYREDVKMMAEQSRQEQADRAWEIFDQGMKKQYGNDYDSTGKYKEQFMSLYARGENGQYLENSSISESTKTIMHDIKEDMYAKQKREAAAKAGVPYIGNGPYNYRRYNSEQHYVDQYEQKYGQQWTYVRTYLESHSWNGGICSKCGEPQPAPVASGGGAWWDDGDNTDYSKYSKKKTCNGACSNSCQAGNNVILTTDTRNGKGTGTGNLSIASSNKMKMTTKRRASGGFVSHGIYELGERGTETVLTAQQTQVLRNNILSNRPSSLISLLKTYNEGFSRMDTPFTGEVSTDNSITIENMNMTMDVKQISNDYDARRAGEQAMNEMMRIARKTSAANSIRR